MIKRNFIKHTSTFLSLISAGVLTLSVTYDYGYLLRLGVSFAEAPTTLSDHIRGSLVWLPHALITVFGVFALELFNRRVEQGMTEEEIIATSSNPKKIKWLRESPWYLVIALAASILVLYFFTDFYYENPFRLQMLQFSLVVSWFVFHHIAFSHPRIIERTSKGFYLVTNWCPAAMIFVVFQGYISADNLVKAVGNEYIFEADGREEKLVLARHFDKYFLAWNKEKSRVEFIATDTVKKFYPYSDTKENKEKQP